MLLDYFIEQIQKVVTILHVAQFSYPCQFGIHYFLLPNLCSSLFVHQNYAKLIQEELLSKVPLSTSLKLRPLMVTRVVIIQKESSNCMQDIHQTK
jgi:hypothetical protein